MQELLRAQWEAATACFEICMLVAAAYCQAANEKETLLHALTVALSVEKYRIKKPKESTVLMVWSSWMNAVCTNGRPDRP